jgi:hypothetical protein
MLLEKVLLGVTQKVGVREAGHDKAFSFCNFSACMH